MACGVHRELRHRLKPAWAVYSDTCLKINRSRKQRKGGSSEGVTARYGIAQEESLQEDIFSMPTQDPCCVPARLTDCSS